MLLRLSGQLFRFGPESVIAQHQARIEGIPNIGQLPANPHTPPSFYSDAIN